MNLVTTACSRLNFRALLQQELRLFPRLSVDNQLTKILVTVLFFRSDEGFSFVDFRCYGLVIDQSADVHYQKEPRVALIFLAAVCRNQFCYNKQKSNFSRPTFRVFHPEILQNTMKDMHSIRFYFLHIYRNLL